MAVVSISLCKELQKRSTAGLTARLEKVLSGSLAYGKPVFVAIDVLDLDQPKASIIMSDFGNIEPLDAETLMGDAHEIVVEYFDLLDRDVRVLMQAELTLKF